MAPRLFLVVGDPTSITPDILTAALAEGDVACLLFAGGNVPAGLVRVAQDAGCAALLDGMADNAVDAALTMDADGVGFLSAQNDMDEIAAARGALGADRIVGSIADSRHAAMELAEAGADFVAFDLGTPQGANHLTWWAEVAQTPMVAVTNDPTASIDELMDAAKKSATLEAEFFAFCVGDNLVEQVGAVYRALQPVT